MPKTPSSVKQEANDTFQDLIQKKQQEVVQNEKEIIPDKKAPQKESQSETGKTEQKEPADQKQPQQEQVKDEDQTLAETGYIPAEILLANQLVQPEPEVQVEVVEVAAPVVEVEENAGLALQPEVVQEAPVQQDVQPQMQQEQSSEAFGEQMKQTAQPQQEQPVAQVETPVQTVRPETVEQKAETVEVQKPQQQQQDDTEILSAQEAPETPLFRNVEHTPVKVAEPQQVDTQQPDMDVQLTQKIQQALDQGAQRVEIQLTPENLGTLTIQMTRNVDGSLQVVLHTASEKAMSLLSQHAEQMSILLQGGGQQVQLEVRQNDGSQQAQQQDQQHQQQQTDADGRNQNQQRQPKHQEQHRNSQDFMQQMRLGLITVQEGV